MSRLGFVLRMAAREIRAAPRRLLLLTGSIAVGVAALVAIDSFTDNLRDSVRGQARALLGADLALSSRRPLPKPAEAVLDTLVARGGRLARLTSFSGMAYVSRTSGTRLVQVAAVGAGYPFYGEIRTAPAAAWSELRQGARVVVDPSLLTALGARLGDTLSLGDGRFVISGTIVSAPGNVGVRAAFGPRVYISAGDLPATHLLGFGSRAEYEAYVRLPATASPEALARRFRPALLPERVRVRTVAEDQRNLNDALGRLTGYLGLVALIALLLGGIGVASGVVVFIRQRLDTIAVLRCLGASARRVLAVYAAEAAAMGLAGSVAGAALGVLAQRQLPGLLAGLLPVDVRTAVSLRAVALGLGMGVWVALVFALLPLLAVRRVPPLAALRRDVEPEPGRRMDPWRVAAVTALAASTVALAALQVGSWRQGAIFSGGVAVALLVLWGASWALIRAARRWLPAALALRVAAGRRQPASALEPDDHRRARHRLRRLPAGHPLPGAVQPAAHAPAERRARRGPTWYCSTSSPTSSPPSSARLAAGGYPAAGPVPIVPMRIQSINGRPVTHDARRHEPGRRCRRGPARRLGAPPRVPLDLPRHAGDLRAARERPLVDPRRDAGADLGRARPGPRARRRSGRPRSCGTCRACRSRPGSRACARWTGRGSSPTSSWCSRRARSSGHRRRFVTLTRIDRAAERGTFQRRIAERLPNVTSVDLSSVQETLERLIDRVVLAIRFMALFTLATGTLVLAGALATSRFQRIREGALLRTLGATRAQLLRIVLSEYLSLGLLSAAVALLLAGVAGWASRDSCSMAGSPCRCFRLEALAPRWWRSPWPSAWPTVARCSAGRRWRCCGPSERGYNSPRAGVMSARCHREWRCHPERPPVIPSAARDLARFDSTAATGSDPVS